MAHDEDENEGDDALAGCFRAALARGTYGQAGEGSAADDEAAAEQRFGRRPSKAQVAEVAGFNLHASVVIGARDTVGRERLLRYVARPPVVNERVTELPDGRVAYRLKLPGGRGETHRIMAPMEFMARLAALVPPPRHPLVRHHGVFAPNSPWRGAVIPTAPPAERGRPASGETPRPAAGKEPPQSVPMGTAQRHPDGGDVFPVADGVVVAKPPRLTTRIDRATLLRRVWGVDALKCPRGEGPMKVIATIHDRVVTVRILAHLRLPTVEMLPAPARRWDDTS